jgi:hypothetical protein
MTRIVAAIAVVAGGCAAIALGGQGRVQALPQGSSRLVVYQVKAGPGWASGYQPGYRSYVKITSLDGSHSNIQSYLPNDTISLRLARGSYRVESWTQPCATACAGMGHPIDDCTTTVRLRGGEQRAMVIRLAPGRCRITPLRGRPVPDIVPTSRMVQPNRLFWAA